MSFDWPIVRLENVTSRIGDGLHGTPKYDDNGDYYFINGNNLSNGRIVINEKTKRTDKEQYLKHKKDINDRTLFVSINGTLGNIATYREEKIILGKSACYLNVLPEVDKDYIKYVLTSKHFQDYIHNLATGSTIKNVGLKLIREYEFRLPELAVQKEVSNILNAIDFKIENNTQTNQTLEQMAQAIFKSWFVDFDPVKAKMNGEQPNGMDTATASLFPEKLVESELGLIPEGWQVGKLSELIKFANGKSGTKSDSGQFPLYGANGIIGFSEEAMFEDAVIIGRVGAYCGAIEYCNSQFWASDNTIVATAKGGKAQLPFVLYLLKFLDLNQHAGGAAQPLLNQKVLNSLEVPIPSNAVLEKYGELLATMLDKMTHNIEENHNLESLRETLLPKLLSGEIDLTSEVVE
ncbi:restriction endonuclease subunit S [Vibrio vulnificus]|nr:restriction endonuclease subunit S [Vibrio vulnificus]